MMTTPWPCPHPRPKHRLKTWSFSWTRNLAVFIKYYFSILIFFVQYISLYNACVFTIKTGCSATKTYQIISLNLSIKSWMPATTILQQVTRLINFPSPLFWILLFILNYLPLWSGKQVPPLKLPWYSPLKLFTVKDESMTLNTL